MHNKNPHPDDLASQIENFEFAFADALEDNGFGCGHNIKAIGKWKDILLPDQLQSRKTKKSGAAKLTFGGDGVVIDRRQRNKRLFVWTPDQEVKLSPEQREAFARQNGERAAKQKQQQQEARRK